MSDPDGNVSLMTKLQSYTNGYKQIAIYALIAGILMIAISPLVRKLMHRRWWRARGVQLHVNAKPRSRAAEAAPVIMVAVDTTHPNDARQPALQRATERVLSLSAEFRLICVSVIRGGPAAGGAADSASGAYLDHLVSLRHWVEPLRLSPRRLSLHVIESPRPEGALLEFARRNNVDLILIGAPSPTQHALAWWRSVASGVTARAHCSVYAVRIPEPELNSEQDGDFT